MASKAHPGFKGAARQVMQREHVSAESANKIIGFGKAHASPKAKRANPRLMKKGGRGR